MINISNINITPNPVDINNVFLLQALIEYYEGGNYPWSNMPLLGYINYEFNSAGQWLYIPTTNNITGTWSQSFDDKFYKTNTSNQFAYSYNGIDWINGLTDDISFYTFEPIVYNGTTYMRIGNDSGSELTVIFTSTNGIDWQQSATSFYTTFNGGKSFCVGDKFFILSSSVNYDINFIASSSNGIDWTTGTLPSNGNWNTIEYVNGIYYMVYKSLNYNASNTAVASDKILYSTDGITWLESTLPASIRVTYVFHDNERFFVLTSDTTTNFYYTTDAINWNTITMPSSYIYHCGFSINGIISILKYDSTDTNAYYSSDLTTWNTTALPYALIYMPVYSNNYCGFVYNSGNKYLVQTCDGINWGLSTLPFAGFTSMGYGEDTGAFIMSYGTQTAIAQTLPSTITNCTVKYGFDRESTLLKNGYVRSTPYTGCYWNGKYHVFTNLGGYWTSDNGYTWTQKPKFSTGYWHHVRLVNGRLFALADLSTGETDKYWTSTDGENWVANTVAPFSNGSWTPRSVAYFKDNYYFFSESSATSIYYTSTDEISFGSWALPSPLTCHECATNGEILIVGISSSTYTYNIEGEHEFVSASFPLASGYIVYGKDKFVALDSSGNVAYSSNGLDWTVKNKVTSINYSLYQLTYSDTMDMYFAFGYATANSKILVYSYDGITWKIVPTGAFTLYAGRDMIAGNGNILMMDSGGLYIYGMTPYFEMQGKMLKRYGKELMPSNTLGEIDNTLYITSDNKLLLLNEEFPYNNSLIEKIIEGGLL